jgi:hypothetical protein
MPFFGKLFDISKIYIPDHWLSKAIFKRKDARSDAAESAESGVSFLLGNPVYEREVVLRGGFFYSSNLSGLYRPQPPAHTLIQQFKSQLGFNYPNTAEKPKQLSIHIRSGDVFGASGVVHKGYGQPPLAYYKKVIRDFEPSEVTLVFQCKENPVIEFLIKFLESNNLPFKCQSINLYEDVQSLLKASSIVMGNGTFVPGVVALSDSVQRVFCFNNMFDLMGREDVERVLYIDEPGEYASKILDNNWENNLEQRDLMISYSEEAIKRVDSKKTIT